MKKSEILNLKDVFNGGDNLFVIPDYQRAYSWENSERQDLIEDLENISITPNFIHFTGTIVATKNVDNSFNIVDGQQRLTSLIILLGCIFNSEKVSKETKEEIEKTFLYQGKDTGNTKRIFKLNGELDEYFIRKIEDPNYNSEEHATKAHQNIDNAFNQFNNWLNKNSYESENFIKNLYITISTKLGFLFHIPSSSKEAGLMFEVINNRGKELSELEKIKNYLIYFAEKVEIGDLYTSVNQYWGKVLYHLNACNHTSNQDENNFLRNTWVVFEQTNKSESYHVYKNLKKAYPPVKESNWRRLIEYVKFLADAAETYNKLFTRNLVDDKNELKILEQLAYQNTIASVLPLILSVCHKIKAVKPRIELLSLIEKLNFRYYGCGVSGRSDTGNGELFYWANNFHNHKSNTEKDVNELKQKLIEFIERRCNTETFIKYLTLDKDESGDYYHWGSLKYFLANYEEYLATKYHGIDDFTRYLLKQDKSSKNANFEKEHILAAEENSVIELDEYGNINYNKRRLSNFVLLTPSVNKSVKKDPVYVKLKNFISFGEKFAIHRSLAELETLYGKENIKDGEQSYNKETIVGFLDKREKKLIEFALDRWGINDKEKNSKITINSFTELDKVYFLERDSNQTDELSTI